MKRIQKFAAVSVVVGLIGSGIPAMAAEHGYNDHDRGRMEYRSNERYGGDRRGGDRDWNNDRDRRYRGDERWDHDRDRRDYDRGYRYDYAPAPVYAAPAYDNGYYYDRTHNGRTAAIIGSSAAAGAIIGAAAGHGQGAAIGAVIGGIAGVAVSAAADHHDRY